MHDRGFGIIRSMPEASVLARSNGKSADPICWLVEPNLPARTSCWSVSLPAGQQDRLTRVFRTVLLMYL